MNYLNPVWRLFFIKTSLFLVRRILLWLIAWLNLTAVCRIVRSAGLRGYRSFPYQFSPCGGLVASPNIFPCFENRYWITSASPKWFESDQNSVFCRFKIEVVTWLRSVVSESIWSLVGFITLPTYLPDLKTDIDEMFRKRPTFWVLQNREFSGRGLAGWRI